MHSSYGNPRAVGFAAIAITLWMYGMTWAGWFAQNTLGSGTASAVLSFATLALLIAAIVEFLRGDTWHAVFFMLLSAYGWGMSGTGSAMEAGATFAQYTGWWAFTWAVVMFFLWIGVMKARAGAAVMLLNLGIWLAFLALAIAGWAGLQGFTVLGGYIALISGIIGFYATAGEIINISFGRPILPAVSPDEFGQPTT